MCHPQTQLGVKGEFSINYLHSQITDYLHKPNNEVNAAFSDKETFNPCLFPMSLSPPSLASIVDTSTVT